MTDMTDVVDGKTAVGLSVRHDKMAVDHHVVEPLNSAVQPEDIGRNLLIIPVHVVHRIHNLCAVISVSILPLILSVEIHESVVVSGDDHLVSTNAEYQHSPLVQREPND